MKPGQVYTNTSTAPISLIHRASCPWGCTPVFVLDNPKLISSEEFLIFHSLFGPPKWSVFLTDFQVVWKKASFSLFCTSCQKNLFCSSHFCVVRNNDQHSLFTFPIWDWSASQRDLWLYRSLPYPSQCLSEGCSSYLICLFTSAVNTAFFWVPGLFELGNVAVYSRPETSLCGLFQYFSHLVQIQFMKVKEYFTCPWILTFWSEVLWQPCIHSSKTLLWYTP